LNSKSEPYMMVATWFCK